MKRYFEFVEGNSAKFWEIAQGNDVTVRFGRIGTDGQTQTKTLADAAAATKHAEKLIWRKDQEGLPGGRSSLVRIPHSQEQKHHTGRMGTGIPLAQGAAPARAAQPGRAAPCSAYAETERVKDGIEMTDEHGGMLVVEWEGQFYVVYNEDYMHGFKAAVDYEEITAE